MVKINDTTTFPNTAPALTDHMPGTDVSNTTNDASGETVTFLLSAIRDLIEDNLVTPALGTPASGIATNLTGTAAGLTAGNVTTNANLTGDVTSSGSNATTIAAGAVDIAMLSATGTPSSTTYLTGDNTWSTPAGSGLTVTSGAGAPSSTPAAVGDIYVDTTADATYNATGTVSSADWTLNLDENSGTTLTATDAVVAGDSIPFFDASAADAAKQRTWTNTIADLSLLTSGGALGTPSSGNLGSCTAYPGDSSLTTVGTITSGTWTGTTIAVANGGTGVTTSTGTGNAVLSASPTLTGTPVIPSGFTLGANAFTRSGAHDLTLTTGATTNVTLPAAGTLAILGANTFTGAQDFNGQQVEGFLNKVVATVTGALTTTAHSGNFLETSGNVTVPTTAGFNCVLLAGGAHTVTFNSTTSAAMATGDLMTLVVEDATTIHAVLTASADKVTFT